MGNARARGTEPQRIALAVLRKAEQIEASYSPRAVASGNMIIVDGDSPRDTERLVGAILARGRVLGESR